MIMRVALGVMIAVLTSQIAVGTGEPLTGWIFGWLGGIAAVVVPDMIE